MFAARVPFLLAPDFQEGLRGVKAHVCRDGWSRHLHWRNPAPLPDERIRPEKEGPWMRGAPIQHEIAEQGF